MTLGDLIARVASELGCSVLEARRVTEAEIRVMVDSLRQAGRARVEGLGIFTVVARAARTAKLPGASAPVAIPARRNVRFRASVKLKRHL